MGKDTLKEGPALLIDTAVLFQLSGQSTFLDSLPPGMEDLRQTAAAARKEALDIALGSAACSGCSTMTKAMAEFRDGLGRRLAEVQAENAAALDPAAAWISARRGYRPRPITLRYRDEIGSTRLLNF